MINILGKFLQCCGGEKEFELAYVIKGTKIGLEVKFKCLKLYNFMHFNILVVRLGCGMK